MKKILLSIIFCLSICGFTFAQSPYPELDKIKQIKLLESTREDVKRIFADYPFSLDDFVPADNATIHIEYSTGNCSDKDEEWNIPQDIVTQITLVFRSPLKPEVLGVDLSKLIKEKQFKNLEKAFVYHNKSEGIAYDVDQGEIEGITFKPGKENYRLLCDKENVRKYYSSKSWFYEKLKDRLYDGDFFPFAHVTDLTLSVTEITANCSVGDLSPTKSCSDDPKIVVETTGGSTNPTDVLTYKYEISAGLIIGRGKIVTWDLSGVKPGTYRISAGVDNGCGICGRTMTKTVVVKECSDCQPK